MRICPCSGGKTVAYFFFLHVKKTVISRFFLPLYRPPIVQTSSKNATIFVWVTLVITFIVYGRFVSLVIWDITNYLGIAYFTVGKKDKKGMGIASSRRTLINSCDMLVTLCMLYEVSDYHGRNDIGPGVTVAHDFNLPSHQSYEMLYFINTQALFSYFQVVEMSGNSERRTGTTVNASTTVSLGISDAFLAVAARCTEGVAKFHVPKVSSCRLRDRCSLVLVL
jgi:hypothetical protein